MIVLASVLLTAALSTNAEGEAFLKENAGKDGVVTLPSGLQYKVLRKGDGADYPTKDSSCECHYEGTLIDGTEFDSSYARGSPTSFAPNQVIAGWTEAMQLMVEGDKWEMYIPSDLAYGERGSPPKIPGGSALIFRMEIIKIKGGKVPANRCDPLTKEGCDEKEATYIDKQSAWDASKRAAQIERLQGMSGGKMKPALSAWISKRLAILRAVAAGDAAEL